jgi:hypothetical protein
MKINTFIPNGRCRLAPASWASEVTGLSRNRRDRAVVYEDIAALGYEAAFTVSA